MMIWHNSNASSFDGFASMICAFSRAISTKSLSVTWTLHKNSQEVVGRTKVEVAASFVTLVQFAIEVWQLYRQ